MPFPLCRAASASGHRLRLGHRRRRSAFASGPCSATASGHRRRLRLGRRRHRSPTSGRSSASACRRRRRLRLDNLYSEKLKQTGPRVVASTVAAAAGQNPSRAFPDNNSRNRRSEAATTRALSRASPQAIRAVAISSRCCLPDRRRNGPPRPPLSAGAPESLASPNPCPLVDLIASVVTVSAAVQIPRVLPSPGEKVKDQEEGE
ncbi:hypothetical protein U9M48_027263 [Paspalum notatum var. saurae]|uniref:Uncharacterized protein n=1 Tax=Paspalum notatum var. saurae TaxID=547442 RepID=A0AAQ3TUI6_PASNO